MEETWKSLAIKIKREPGCTLTFLLSCKEPLLCKANSTVELWTPGEERWKVKAQLTESQHRGCWRLLMEHAWATIFWDSKHNSQFFGSSWCTSKAQLHLTEGTEHSKVCWLWRTARSPNPFPIHWGSHRKLWAPNSSLPAPQQLPQEGSQLAPLCKECLDST